MHLFFSIVLAAASVAASLYIPVLAGGAIDTIAGAGKVDFAALMPYLYKIGILALAAGAAQWIMNTLNNRITFRVVRDIRNAAMEKIQILPLSYMHSWTFWVCILPFGRHFAEFAFISAEAERSFCVSARSFWGF